MLMVSSHDSPIPAAGAVQPWQAHVLLHALAIAGLTMHRDVAAAGLLHQCHSCVALSKSTAQAHALASSARV